MRDHFAQIERQIEALVEGSLARLLGTQLSASTLAGQLARAMQDGARWDDQGRACAPDEYALTLHPTQVDTLVEQGADLKVELAHGLLEIARNSGYLLGSEPKVTLAADPTLSRGEVRVLAWHSSNPLEFTQAMAHEPKTQPGNLPAGAFLIIDGSLHFALDRPLINIGRRLDNQLILDDPHVSRTHAQLRVRDGRFVLFDLGSTGGTQVNGRRVRQHILRPGDVVTIAGARMVYGEDPGASEGSTPAYSPPFPPRPSGDQDTQVRGGEKKAGQ